jgi:hypothetical protein
MLTKLYAMKSEFKTIFHSRTATGWKPGSFVARTIAEPERVNEINKHFSDTGILIVPISKKRFRKNNICIL